MNYIEVVLGQGKTLVRAIEALETIEPTERICTVRAGVPATGLSEAVQGHRGGGFSGHGGSGRRPDG